MYGEALSGNGGRSAEVGGRSATYLLLDHTMYMRTHRYIGGALGQRPVVEIVNAYERLLRPSVSDEGVSPLQHELGHDNVPSVVGGRSGADPARQISAVTEGADNSYKRQWKTRGHWRR